MEDKEFVKKLKEFAGKTVWIEYTGENCFSEKLHKYKIYSRVYKKIVHYSTQESDIIYALRSFDIETGKYVKEYMVAYDVKNIEEMAEGTKLRGYSYDNRQQFFDDVIKVNERYKYRKCTQYSLVTVDHTVIKGDYLSQFYDPDILDYKIMVFQHGERVQTIRMGEIVKVR